MASRNGRESVVFATRVTIVLDMLDKKATLLFSNSYLVAST